MKALFRYLGSLTLALWLMGIVMLLLALGSFASGEGSGINDMPLLSWLQSAPLPQSWWLWGALGAVALLAVNTAVCAVQSCLASSGRSMLSIAAPHLMHAGFLLIVIAHLFSAYGGRKAGGEATRGTMIPLPSGETVRVDDLQATVSPRGYVTAMSGDVTVLPSGEKHHISPNHPVFVGDIGVYLKHLEPGAMPVAFVELHREPGAPWALAGSVLFLAGNLLLLFRRR